MSNDYRIEEFLKRMKESFQPLVESWAEEIRRGEQVFSSLGDEDRLALCCYLFSVLSEHLREGGTYRMLLYDRLGLGLEAYGAMQFAGALDVHNALIEAHNRRREEGR